MTNRERNELYRELAEHVKAAVENPAQWMRELRRVSDRLGLDPAHSLRIGDVTLIDVCYGLVEYADWNGFTAERVRAGFRA